MKYEQKTQQILAKVFENSLPIPRVGTTIDEGIVFSWYTNNLFMTIEVDWLDDVEVYLEAKEEIIDSILRLTNCLGDTDDSILKEIDDLDELDIFLDLLKDK